MATRRQEVKKFQAVIGHHRVVDLAQFQMCEALVQQNDVALPHKRLRVLVASADVLGQTRQRLGVISQRYAPFKPVFCSTQIPKHEVVHPFFAHHFKPFERAIQTIEFWSFNGFGHIEMGMEKEGMRDAKRITVDVGRAERFQPSALLEEVRVTSLALLVPKAQGLVYAGVRDGLGVRDLEEPKTAEKQHVVKLNLY